MPKLIYRVVSACGALGYGYPKASLDAALRGQVDAIICDGGSMDAGPYYLGTGTEYFEREAVKLDFRHMVEAGARIGCPVVLGSCGMAGGDRNLRRQGQCGCRGGLDDGPVRGAARAQRLRQEPRYGRSGRSGGPIAAIDQNTV